MPLPQDENPTPGFVSLQQYLTANQGALGGMANTLGDVAKAQGATASGDISSVIGQVRPGGQPSALPGYQQADQDAQKASQYAQSLTNYGGLYNDVQGQYGKSGPYTPGDAKFDATLLGTAGPQSQFQGIAKQYGGLEQYLQDSANMAQRLSDRGPQHPRGGGFDSTTSDTGAPLDGGEWRQPGWGRTSGPTGGSDNSGSGADQSGSWRKPRFAGG